MRRETWWLLGALGLVAAVAVVLAVLIQRDVDDRAEKQRQDAIGDVEAAAREGRLNRAVGNSGR